MSIILMKIIMFDADYTWLYILFWLHHGTPAHQRLSAALDNIFLLSREPSQSWWRCRTAWRGCCDTPDSPSRSGGHSPAHSPPQPWRWGGGRGLAMLRVSSCCWSHCLQLADIMLIYGRAEQRGECRPALSAVPPWLRSLYTVERAASGGNSPLSTRN